MAELRTFLPSELYLPEWARDTEFFRAICILLNYTENSLKDFSNPKYAEIEQAYKDIVLKYRDIEQLSEDALKAMIIEQGFGNILDLFNMSLEYLQTFVLYLPLFKALKGTDEGFRLILSLISQNFEIETWIDNPVELDEYTYNISFITFLNLGFNEDIVEKFINFSRSYVYPLLRKMVIKVAYSQATPTIFCRAIVNKSIKAYYVGKDSIDGRVAGTTYSQEDTIDGEVASSTYVTEDSIDGGSASSVFI